MENNIQKTNSVQQKLDKDRLATDDRQSLREGERQKMGKEQKCLLKNKKMRYKSESMSCGKIDDSQIFELAASRNIFFFKIKNILRTEDLIKREWQLMSQHQFLKSDEKSPPSEYDEGVKLLKMEIESISWIESVQYLYQESNWR
ncbi:hypothetical protein RF55_9035 [Lasius niger]|uniref:Uncharacterized protein n=1 Tax=Lasius niger TaxID=67767 RepID=A0A0J7KLM8_LASNI|nr:hypothetical protein RF55_9035 [Lasius niger]